MRGLEEVHRSFAFLVSDYGFFGPIVKTVVYELHHRYRHANSEVDLCTDGSGLYLTITVNGRTFYPEALGYADEIKKYEELHGDRCAALARFLDKHPELLCGDQDYLEGLYEQFTRERKKLERKMRRAPG